ncbi:MAG TPA: WbqC family protein [Bacteroidia bacterium]|nr:WbqC family protein [Bacteroidia bacterium]
MKALLSTAYWPNLHYFFYVLNAQTVTIEQFENYQKQSYRNRTRIFTANGPLDLSIPVTKRADKELTKDIKISYSENWQIRHWRAITSAYNNSPYFDFFEDDIRYFYTSKFESLLNYNTEQLKLVLKLLRHQKNIELTTCFEMPADPMYEDLRSSIHPKISFKKDGLVKERLEISYYQTFENKFDFCGNLSVLDLLFNKGLDTTGYLALK